MNRNDILSKITNDEDRFLVAKLLDKIEFVAKRNSVEYTDFLDIRQSKMLEKVMKELKLNNYLLYGGYSEAERNVLVIFPNKLEDVFKQGKFDYNSIVEVIRIKLPNELKGMYSHRDYLGAVIKIGMKREKVGDIITNNNGADLIVLKESAKYILEGLKGLTRFSKSDFEEVKIEELNIAEPKIQRLEIIVPSMRIDSIVSEAIRISRSKASDMIKEERVFINNELITKGSKEAKEGDKVTVRGKGRFKVGNVINTTKKGNLVLEIEKSIWCLLLEK